MSDADGDGNKTVFRPSPLQGRKTGGFPGQKDWTPPPAGAPPVPQQPVWDKPREASASPEPRDTTALAPSRPAAPSVSTGERHNALLAEATPALALVAGLRTGKVTSPLPQLHEQLVAALGAFDAAIAPLYSDEVRRRARFALSTTIDDVAGRGAEIAEWSPVAEVGGGSGDLWQHVDDALGAPAENRDLLELYQMCIAAGFQGSHRGAPDADAKLRETGARLQSELNPPGIAAPAPPPAAAAPAAPAPEPAVVTAPMAAAATMPARAPAVATPKAGKPVRIVDKSASASRKKGGGGRIGIILILLVAALLLAWVALRMLAPDVLPAPLRLGSTDASVTGAVPPRLARG